MNFLKKLGGVFKGAENGVLWAFRREEVLFASTLISTPAFDKVVLLVRSLDRKNLSGEEKMAEALIKILPLLKECGMDTKKESDLRFIVELAVKVMQHKARVVS